MSATDDKFYRPRITQRVDFAPDLWMIRIHPGGEFKFVPGQYATLGVEGRQKRSERPYSIVSSPYENEMGFFFELVPDGDLTPQLHKLQRGDELLMRKLAKGRFTLDTRSGRTNHLLVCTVTGIAPFVSYVRTFYQDWKEGRFAGEPKLAEDFYARQRELLSRVIAGSDVVITTAVVPGKKAPVLVTREMVKGMVPGSVIFHLAAERGGNCELTRAGQTVVEHGVTIIGRINVASQVPYHASQMYGRNIAAFLLNLVKDGKLRSNSEDEIIRETLLTRGGEIENRRVREFFSLPQQVSQRPPYFASHAPK